MKYTVIYRNKDLNGKIDRKDIFGYCDAMRFARLVGGRLELNGLTVIDIGRN